MKLEKDKEDINVDAADMSDRQKRYAEISAE